MPFDPVAVDGDVRIGFQEAIKLDVRSALIKQRIVQTKYTAGFPMQIKLGRRSSFERVGRAEVLRLTVCINRKQLCRNCLYRIVLRLDSG